MVKNVDKGLKTLVEYSHSNTEFINRPWTNHYNWKIPINVTQNSLNKIVNQKEDNIIILNTFSLDIVSLVQ